MLEARERGYDALILVIDEDGRVERTRQIADAQRDGLAPIRRALGVAIRTFDAWILADEKALTSVLGYDAFRQPNPETINDPKSVCRKLLGDSELLMKPVEMYAAIANAVDLRVLESRCTKGFAPLAQRVRQLHEEGGSV